MNDLQTDQAGDSGVPDGLPPQGDQPPQEQPQEAVPQGKPENPADGYDQVELTPAQQKRFDRIYGQMKHQDRTLKEYDGVFRAQQERIEELMRGQHQIVGHLQEQDFSNAEVQLKQQRKAMRDAGNWDAVDEIDDRLLDIRAKKIAAQSQPKPQQQPVRQQQQQQAQPEGIVIERAVESGYITHDDADMYRAWSNETDEYGNLKRPWVQPNDQRFRAATAEGKAVFSNMAFDRRPFADKLAEIDRRMGLQQRGNTQQVMGANLTRGGNTGKVSVKLSAMEEKIAIGTRFAGPGKSDADHIEAYRKTKLSKGSRK